jgi:hypothetical protein
MNFLGTFAVLWIVVGILAAIGWVINIVHLFGMNPVLTGEGVVRIIGIFVAPLGSIMGLFF